MGIWLFNNFSASLQVVLSSLKDQNFEELKFFAWLMVANRRINAIDFIQGPSLTLSSMVNLLKGD